MQRTHLLLLTFFAAACLILIGCKYSRQGNTVSKIEILRVPPPQLNIDLDHLTDFEHIAVIVDGTETYLPLLIKDFNRTVSCSFDKNLEVHTVIILDHRKLPTPIIGESSEGLQEGNKQTTPTRYYQDNTSVRAVQLFPSLARIAEFTFEGKCAELVLKLKYSEENDGSLKVSHSLANKCYACEISGTESE